LKDSISRELYISQHLGFPSISSGNTTEQHTNATFMFNVILRHY